MSIVNRIIIRNVGVRAVDYDLTPPTAPSNVRLTDLTSTTVTMAWDASSDDVVGVAGYEVQLGSGSWVSVGNVLTYTFTSLTPSTDYTMRVRALDKATVPNISQSVALVTRTLAINDTVAPTVPGSFRVTAQASTSISVAWNASTDAATSVGGYEVQRDAGAWTPVGNVLTYTFTGLAASTAYTLRVRAFDTAPTPNTSAAATLSSSTVAGADTTAPSVPTNFRTTSKTVSSITVAWNASTDAESGIAGYDVSIDGGAYTSLDNVLTYTFTGLVASSSHTMRVRARDAAPTPNVSTPASLVDTASAPATPTNLRTTAITNTSITYAWNAPATGTLLRYETRIGTTAAPGTFASNGTALTQQRSSLAQNTSYVFGVRAVYTDGSVSAEVTINAQTTGTTTTTAKTAYGACPDGGGASAVITKYGTKASIRVFSGSGFASTSRPSTATRVHASWKPALGSTVTDAQVIAACSTLKDGDIVEAWHEADVKYRKGDDLPAMLNMKNQLHDKVVALRNAGTIPRVLTCNTWAGWSVDSTSSINTSNLHCRADLLGIDMDGIPANDNFYPYAARQMGTKFVNSYKTGGYTGWVIPEFCMPSVASDANRTRRIAWFQSETDIIELGVPTQNIPPPLMIAWFDTSGIIGATEKLTAANEIAAWSALVSGNEYP